MFFKYIFYTAICIVTLNATRISGVVVDKISKSPVRDVNIVAGDIGTITDNNGEFELQTNLEFIIINHVGYNEQKVFITEKLYIELTPTVIISDEVLVLSSLEPELYINTAASISIFKQKDIERLNQIHFQNLIDFVPNLNWAGGTSRPRYFQIRGIGERSQYFGEGSPNFSVNYIIDDIDLSGIGMIGGLQDIRQIEVAKGPQSTVFGNNSLGGSISLQTNEPEHETSYNLSTKIGSDNLKNYGFIANFKIVNGTYIRINAYNNSQDGYRQNKFFNLKNTNNKDESFFKIKLKFKPNQKLSISNTAILSEMDNGYDSWAPDNNKDYETYTDQPGEDSQKTNAFSSKVEYKQDKWGLLGIVSGTLSNLIHSYDGDWGNNAFWEDSTTYGYEPYYDGYSYQFFDKTSRQRKTYTAEGRFVARKNIIGFYIKTLQEEDDAVGWLFGGDAAQANSRYNMKIKAVYAQTELNLNEKISSTTSIRFENNEILYTGNSYANYGDELPFVKTNKTYGLLGFKSTLLYKINNFTRAYSHISRGYKSGGVNQQPYVSAYNRHYNPEYLNNYEIGFRALRDKSFMSLSLFYSDRINQQISVSAQQDNNNPNSFYYFTANSGKGWIKGAEIDYNRKLTKYVSITSSFGFLDTWIDEFAYETSKGDTIGGNRQAPMSPNFTVSVILAYQNNGYFLTLSHSYKDEYYFSDSHNNKADAYSLNNLSLGRNFNNISLSIWVNNLFDKRFQTRGFYFELKPPNYDKELFVSYGDPIQFGFAIDYSF
ncbi:MAG: hypothetical protein CBD77_00980 [bacterium TMED217]|nr:MAG: hypothetical protein CBD77_00980 [bacterium TMED217]